MTTEFQLSRIAIGERIRAARLSRGWLQRELAEALGLSGKSVIASWEGGWTTPSLRHLVALSKLLRRSLDWLLKGEKRSRSKLSERLGSEAVAGDFSI
ncbi:MAG: helix-turn-helix transcriptional regulator [Planctomycetota bacterium]